MLHNINDFVKEKVAGMVNVSKPTQSRTDRLSFEERKRIAEAQKVTNEKRARLVEDFIKSQYWTELISPYIERRLCALMGDNIRPDAIKKSELELKVNVAKIDALLEFVAELEATRKYTNEPMNNQRKGVVSCLEMQKEVKDVLKRKYGT